MKDFKIEFIATEVTAYSASVKAKTKEAALKRFLKCPSDFHWDDEYMEFSIVNEDTAKVVGHWVPDPDKSMQTLKRYET